MRTFVPPSSRPRSLAPSLPRSWVCSAAHAPSHLLVRTSPCSLARLPPALLTPGANTSCLLARALNPSLPRLIPASAITHHSHVNHDPTSAAGTLATERDTPLALLATIDWTRPFHLRSQPSELTRPSLVLALLTVPRTRIFISRRVLTSVSTLVPPFLLVRASSPVTHALGA
ncbi:hypothetical protein FRC08_011461 [Ceratobasidium sp. 394]|nr:hypothetical protein FRC08_011461 [Ceratobasidium sp. 394]